LVELFLSTGIMHIKWSNYGCYSLWLFCDN